MTNPARKHILFALQSLAHLPYHVSTLVALDELEARVTVVFCRGRKAKKNVPAATPADDAAFLAWVDAIPVRHPNLAFFEEREGNSIRARVNVDAGWAWPRTLRSYSHYLRRLGPRSKYTERWRNYLPRRLRVLTRFRPARSVLATDFAFRRLTAMENRMPVDPEIAEWLRANGVDAVVASPTNRRHSSEAEFVKSARCAGIPTAVSVLSWDTLSTKGLIPCPPTMLLAWNDSHASDAIELHGLDPDSVVVAGSPFFDKWFRKEDIGSRAGLLARLGLLPDAHYLLYLGSSTMIAFNESWLVQQVRETLDRTPALAGLELVVRPHPANDRLVHDLHGLPRVHIDVSGLPFSDETQRHLAGVIRQAEAFFGVNTSGMLDAIILDRPGFSILTDDYRETQSDAPHFRDLLEAQALYLEPDLDSFADRLTSVLAGNDPKAAERAQFVRRFVRPRGPDIPAGRVQAEAILRLAEGEAPREIQRLLDRLGAVGTEAGE